MGKEQEPRPWDNLLKESAELERPAMLKMLDPRKKFKHGQRFPTPPVAEATRAFYESLLDENPDSKIAIKYCVEYGVLSGEAHQVACKKYSRLREKGSFSLQRQVSRAVERKEKHRREKAWKEQRKASSVPMSLVSASVSKSSRA